MATSSKIRFNTIQFLCAVFAIIGLHSLVGWQWALIVPLVYAYFLPSESYQECALQMLCAYLVLFVASYSLAPEETARMLESVAVIIARNAGRGFGWALPVVSLLFAALMGFLAGVVGSGLRLMLRNVHKFESGII
jgi:hypothetical protein